MAKINEVRDNHVEILRKEVKTLREALLAMVYPETVIGLFACLDYRASDPKNTFEAERTEQAERYFDDCVRIIEMSYRDELYTDVQLREKFYQKTAELLVIHNLRDSVDTLRNIAFEDNADIYRLIDALDTCHYRLNHLEDEVQF